jgi:hypothetical protein
MAKTGTSFSSRAVARRKSFIKQSLHAALGPKSSTPLFDVVVRGCRNQEVCGYLQNSRNDFGAATDQRALISTIMDKVAKCFS